MGRQILRRHPHGRGARLRSLWALCAVAGALHLGLAALRPSLERIWGDEGTYLAMTASLVRDGDLRFADADRRWAEARLPGEGVTVILQRHGDDLFYSKPPLYPLLASPFFALLGEPGMVLFNVLALSGGAALAWRELRRRGPPAHASWTLATFLLCSALPAYLLWRVSDALQAAFALAGIALCCGGAVRKRGEPDRERGGRGAAAGLLLGLLAAMRYPNALLGAAAILAALLARRTRRALAASLAAAATFALAAAAAYGLTGAANPYKAPRTSFNASTGYPTEAGAPELERFTAAPATQALTWRPAADPTRALYSGLTYLIGRHSGLLAYFPFALLASVTALRRPGPPGAVLLAGVAAYVLFYLIWMPWNYFGGSTFVGNRYFVAAYPVLLLAPPRLPSRRGLAAVWALALVAGLSALVSVRRTGGADRMSQSHASAGLFRLLPYETTALEIDGQRDRYWAGDFVRFVDPHARVDGLSFRLESGGAPAELVLATAAPGSAIHFLVEPAEGKARLRVGDWGRRRRLVPDAPPEGPPGLLRFNSSPAWRRHRFWWPGEAIYRVRTVRLRLEQRAGRPAAATVRYLGDGRILRRGFAREVLAAPLPGRGEAGAVTEIPIRLRNSGDWTWSSREVLPIHLGYRLHGAGSQTPREGPRTRLAAPVAPGQILEARVEVRWPDQPGLYRLEIDLVQEQVAWFAERLGEPVARGRVRVVH